MCSYVNNRYFLRKDDSLSRKSISSSSWRSAAELLSHVKVYTIKLDSHQFIRYRNFQEDTSVGRGQMCISLSLRLETLQNIPKERYCF